MSKARIFRSLTCFSQRQVRDFFHNSSIVYQSSFCIIRKYPTYLSSKLLVAIPKSFGSAPCRNLYKRRLKHIFFEQKLFKSNAQWGILIKKNAQANSYKDLKELMITLMSEV